MARKNNGNGDRDRLLQQEERAWQDYTIDIVGDVHEPSARAAAIQIAERYVASLREMALEVLRDPRKAGTIRRTTNTPANEELNSIHAAFWLYERCVEEVWGPLLIAFLDWMWTSIEPDQVPVFLLRDAGAMLYLTQQPGNRPPGRAFELLHLSREILGIQDLWTGKYKGQVEAKVLLQYLGSLDLQTRTRTGRSKYVLVDTGAYGSLQRRLAEYPFRMALETRFLFSHNPWIPGWLNIIGVPPALGEVIMDSLEFLLPQKYKKVVALLRKSLKGPRIPKPVLEHTGKISRRLYEATGRGIENTQRPGGVANCETDEGFREVVRVIARISRLQRGAQLRVKWTGVLAEPTPKSREPEFVDEYPEELREVNPAHLLPGGYSPHRRLLNLSRLGM